MQNVILCALLLAVGNVDAVSRRRAKSIFDDINYGDDRTERRLGTQDVQTEPLGDFESRFLETERSERRSTSRRSYEENDSLDDRFTATADDDNAEFADFLDSENAQTRSLDQFLEMEEQQRQDLVEFLEREDDQRRALSSFIRQEKQQRREMIDLLESADDQRRALAELLEIDEEQRRGLALLFDSEDQQRQELADLLEDDAEERTGLGTLMTADEQEREGVVQFMLNDGEERRGVAQFVINEDQSDESPEPSNSGRHSQTSFDASDAHPSGRQTADTTYSDGTAARTYTKQADDRGGLWELPDLTDSDVSDRRAYGRVSQADIPESRSDTDTSQLRGSQFIETEDRRGFPAALGTEGGPPIAYPILAETTTEEKYPPARDEDGGLPRAYPIFVESDGDSRRTYPSMIQTGAFLADSSAVAVEGGDAQQ